MKRRVFGIVFSAVCIMSLLGCSTGDSAAETVEAANADSAEVETVAVETVNERTTVDAVETEEEVSQGLVMSDDLYERIASDIIELSVNPDTEFDYGADCVLKSIDKDTATGASIVNVIISKELGDNVFPRIIGAINKDTGDSLIVGLEEDPENLKNVKVNLCSIVDGSVVCTRASVHDEGDGTYLIVYYGE